MVFPSHHLRNNLTAWLCVLQTVKKPGVSTSEGKPKHRNYVNSIPNPLTWKHEYVSSYWLQLFHCYRSSSVIKPSGIRNQTPNNSPTSSHPSPAANTILLNYSRKSGVAIWNWRSPLPQWFTCPKMDMSYDVPKETSEMISYGSWMELGIISGNLDSQALKLFCSLRSVHVIF